MPRDRIRETPIGTKTPRSLRGHVSTSCRDDAPKGISASFPIIPATRATKAPLAAKAKAKAVARARANGERRSHLLSTESVPAPVPRTWRLALKRIR